MVPSAFVRLEAFPLTPSGKVDRKALPAPELEEMRREEFVAPRTALEEVVAGIWAPLLGLRRVGAHDNFFELGGHSLLATQVVSRLREVLQVELPVRVLFEAPTVAELAARLESMSGANQGSRPPPLLPMPRNGELPLSFAQQRCGSSTQLDARRLRVQRSLRHAAEGGARRGRAGARPEGDRSAARGAADDVHRGERAAGAADCSGAVARAARWRAWRRCRRRSAPVRSGDAWRRRHGARSTCGRDRWCGRGCCAWRRTSTCCCS